MEKNIVVLDENGNQTGLTYPKRARGLVKSGRAETVDSGTIRLTSPPSDKERTENMSDEAKELTELGEKINEAVQRSKTATQSGAPAPSVDMGEIAARVDALMAGQSAQLTKLMEVLEKADFDYKVDAVKVMTDALRETTNNALEVYRAAALGLADLSAAVKADPGCGPFVVGLTANYRDVINAKKTDSPNME